MRSILRSLCIGSAVMLAGVLAFVILAGALTPGSPLIRLDQVISDALRASLAPRALPVFTTLTHLADTVTLTVLCVLGTLVLVARRKRGLAFVWVLAIAGNAILNESLKRLIGRVRPLDPEGSLTLQGLSFPSGHTSGAVVAYGMLAYLALPLLPKAWHLAVLVTALALAVTVGLSRVALCITSAELMLWWQAHRATEGRSS